MRSFSYKCLKVSVEVDFEDALAEFNASLAFFKACAVTNLFFVRGDKGTSGSSLSLSAILNDLLRHRLPASKSLRPGIFKRNHVIRLIE
jgi:hypothetical protein